MGLVIQEKRLREKLRWSDNNRILGQIAYSIRNIANFVVDDFKINEVGELAYEQFMLEELSRHAKYLQEYLIPAIKQFKLSDKWLVAYRDEFMIIRTVLDDFNVV
ncbi:hypothetical protein [Leuconostoc pseudomesenteroides]|uniref:hypothetical protein n=1 Tax=Leuconostoc pseudomesenteroides TaxID=33968 RepID=UPI002285DA0E|nr:hypothetical protein [Leuconostoc pseudomesenteroides]WAM37607.1 hypothetical protein OYT93_05195 [Leuconostoc pseudomesenteroides]